MQRVSSKWGFDKKSSCKYWPVDGHDSCNAFLDNHEMSLYNMPSVDGPRRYVAFCPLVAEDDGMKAASGNDKLSYIRRKEANKI